MSPYLSEEFRSSKRILAGSRCSPLSCTGGTHKLEKPRRFKALPLQKPWAISNVLDYDGSHGDFLVKIRKAPFKTHNLLISFKSVLKYRIFNLNNWRNWESGNLSKMKCAYSPQIPK